MSRDISPESRAEIDKLMKPLRNATSKEERQIARENINAKVRGERK